MSRTIPTPYWLSEPGVVCALGDDSTTIFARLMDGWRGGMQPLEGWIDGRTPVLGQVRCALPRLPDSLPPHLHSRNNQLLLAAAQRIDATLQRVRQRYAPTRIGLVLGTSTSGVNDNASAFRDLARAGEFPASYDYRRQRMSAPSEFLAAYLGIQGPAHTVSTACTSSARALLTGRTLLDMNLCDAVICGGADTLCRLTINGFAALEAISDAPCQPFSAHRRGINIGEAGVLFVLERETASEQPAIAMLGGAGSSDAWHMSAPEPTGRGAQKAMQQALQQADLQPRDIGWVNLHGTATELNDAMESHAMQAIFPDGVACASTKALTGHTLGAAGALEAALCWLALSPHINPDGLIPPHVWDGAPDPALPALQFSTPGMRFGPTSRHGFTRLAMNNSFAFGGNNTSLILGARA